MNFLRSPATPGNQVEDGEETLAAQFRRLSSQLARAWAICGRSENLVPLRGDAQFYEEVRVWMGKFDAEERHASGEPVPEDVERLLAQLMAGSVVSSEVLDIYGAAGMPRPALSDLSPELVARTQAAANPHLAIEALRQLGMAETRAVTRHNIVRQRAFSERLVEIMAKHTNQQRTSEADRGAHFTPPLTTDELAFYDAVAANESAVELQGETVLATIARELVTIMRRDIKTDWTVRDDVKAKLRSSIKRLLVKYDYPPDRQPAAIKLVMEQMESMAPRLAA